MIYHEKCEYTRHMHKIFVLIQQWRFRSAYFIKNCYIRVYARALSPHMACVLCIYIEKYKRKYPHSTHVNTAALYTSRFTAAAFYYFP